MDYNRNFAKTMITVALSVIATMLALFLFVFRSNVLVDKDTYAAISDTLVLSEIANDIEKEFYGEAVPSKAQLVDIAARSMVELINDPYAQYFTKDEYDEFLKSFDGEYVGLGILVAAPDEVGAIVVTVYEGASADRAGMKPGDIILSANGESTANLTTDELSELLSGEKGSFIKLNVSRGGEAYSFDVLIDDVAIRHVHSSVISYGTKKVGYIKLDMFSGDCVNEFKDAIASLADDGMQALIVDLRNNPGGSLSAVVDICDAVMDGGEIVRVGKSHDDSEIYSAHEGSPGVPLALLINENSASASEIMAAAIKDNTMGILVGENTYGKGIVQTTLPLNSNGGYLKLTTDAYFTPNGSNIHGVGVAPDFELKLSDEQKALGEALFGTSDDSQLNLALEKLFG